MITIKSAAAKAKTHERALWLALTVAFIVPFSFYVMLCFIVGSDFLGINVRSAGAMLDGSAITPHVYRQMVPVMANSIIAITPEALRLAVEHMLQGWLSEHVSMFAQMVRFRHPNVPPAELTTHLYAFAVVNVIDYAFLLGYVYYTWALARRLFAAYFSIQVLAPCFAIIAIPPLCAKFAYIYDFPVLFFSAWLTYVLLEKRLVLFTVAIALATFNKETSFYLIAVFAMYGYSQLPRRTWAVHLLCQCFLFVLIKGGVTLYYQQNHGEFLWVYGWYDHIMTNMDGYTVYTFLGLMAAVALLGFRWKAQPLLLQCWMVMLPFSVLSWYLFGMRNEYRVMYEMFPALILISCHTLAYLLQGQETDHKNQGFHAS